MTPPRASTGTGAQRRRLTLAEALAGALPDPFTDDEWRAMHKGGGPAITLCALDGMTLREAAAQLRGYVVVERDGQLIDSPACHENGDVIRSPDRARCERVARILEALAARQAGGTP